MPPLVFDFASIASRLRKDDFYTPAPKAKGSHLDPDAPAYLCHACDVWFDSLYVTSSGTAICPSCGAFNRCFFP